MQLSDLLEPAAPKEFASKLAASLNELVSITKQDKLASQDFEHTARSFMVGLLYYKQKQQIKTLTKQHIKPLKTIIDDAIARKRRLAIDLEHLERSATEETILPVDSPIIEEKDGEGQDPSSVIAQGFPDIAQPVVSTSIQTPASKKMSFWHTITAPLVAIFDFFYSLYVRLTNKTQSMPVAPIRPPSSKDTSAEDTRLQDPREQLQTELQQGRIAQLQTELKSHTGEDLQVEWAQQQQLISDTQQLMDHKKLELTRQILEPQDYFVNLIAAIHDMPQDIRITPSIKKTLIETLLGFDVDFRYRHNAKILQVSNDEQDMTFLHDILQCYSLEVSSSDDIQVAEPVFDVSSCGHDVLAQMAGFEASIKQERAHVQAVTGQAITPNGSVESYLKSRQLESALALFPLDYSLISKEPTKKSIEDFLTVLQTIIGRCVQYDALYFGAIGAPLSKRIFVPTSQLVLFSKAVSLWLVGSLQVKEAAQLKRRTDFMLALLPALSNARIRLPPGNLRELYRNLVVSTVDACSNIQVDLTREQRATLKQVNEAAHVNNEINQVIVERVTRRRRGRVRSDSVVSHECREKLGNWVSGQSGELENRGQPIPLSLVRELGAKMFDYFSLCNPLPMTPVASQHVQQLRHMAGIQGDLVGELAYLRPTLKIKQSPCVIEPVEDAGWFDNVLKSLLYATEKEKPKLVVKRPRAKNVALEGAEAMNYISDVTYRLEIASKSQRKFERDTRQLVLLAYERIQQYKKDHPAESEQIVQHSTRESVHYRMG